MMKIIINKEELIRLMSEYWATCNNIDCAKETKAFCEKYGIKENEISMPCTWKEIEHGDI